MQPKSRERGDNPPPNKTICRHPLTANWHRKIWGFFWPIPRYGYNTGPDAGKSKTGMNRTLQKWAACLSEIAETGVLLCYNQLRRAACPYKCSYLNVWMQPFKWLYPIMQCVQSDLPFLMCWINHCFTRFYSLFLNGWSKTAHYCDNFCYNCCDNPLKQLALC